MKIFNPNKFTNHESVAKRNTADPVLIARIDRDILFPIIQKHGLDELAMKHMTLGEQVEFLRMSPEEVVAKVNEVCERHTDDTYEDEY